MRITDALEVACGGARRVKEEHVRRVKGKPDRTDIMTVVACYRGGNRVGAVFTPPDRDRMLRIAWLAAAGFSADLLTVTMESWTGTTNPLTGKDWGPGEMSDAVANHDGLAKGWITECLMTQVCNRAGDAMARNQPYILHGRVVEWLDVAQIDSNDEDMSLTGIVPEALVAAMNQPAVDHWMSRDRLATALVDSLGLERSRAHMDVATVTALADREGNDVLVALEAKPGTVREQVIRERFPRSRVIRPGEWGN